MKKTPFTPYQRKLFFFLSVATFFEGYDFFALTQILTNLREEFDLPMEASAYIVGTVNIGTILAFWLVRKADVWGRRRVLTITIFGYTLFTVLSGFAPNIYLFVAAQLLARVFLLAEWAISMVIAAEEFPADRRGMTLGVIQACSSLGSIFCAGVVPLLLSTPYGWRTVYFVGVIPLVILMAARRGLKETKRFTAISTAVPPDGPYREQKQAFDTQKNSLFAIWKTPHARNVVVLAAIWFVAYIPAQNAVAFWKEFAIHERGFTDVDVSKSLTFAALVSMPFVFGSGKILDKFGRKLGAAIVFSLGGIGVVLCYTLESKWALTGALTLGIFGASAYLPLLNAYTSELFPTELRGTAAAWTNNLLGRFGYVLSPFLVGLAVTETGAYGPVVASTAIFSFVSIGLIYWLLPETANKELEETAVSA